MRLPTLLAFVSILSLVSCDAVEGEKPAPAVSSTPSPPVWEDAPGVGLDYDRPRYDYEPEFDCIDCGLANAAGQVGAWMVGAFIGWLVE